MREDVLISVYRGHTEAQSAGRPARATWTKDDPARRGWALFLGRVGSGQLGGAGPPTQALGSPFLPPRPSCWL